MKVQHEDLGICVDCVMFVANGEVTDSEGSDITAEHAAKITEEWGDNAKHLVLACPEECEGWFSHDSCDGCGSPLGGERHPAAVLTND